MKNTGTSEIIAMFLLLQKMEQGDNRNNLKLHFEISYMNLTGIFTITQKLKFHFSPK